MRRFRFHTSLAMWVAAAVLGGCGAHNASLPLAQPPVTTGARNALSALTVLHVFHAPPRGQNPMAPLVADAAGNLYGETSQGGMPTLAGGCGTVFKLTLSAGRYVETTLHKFHHKPDGCSPAGGLTIDSNGAMYGTTLWGGATRGQGAGTVFKFAPSGSGYAYSVIYRFRSGRNGAEPVGAPVAGPNGVLYGATEYGAAYACAKNTEGCGIVYSLTPSGSKYSEKILYVFKGGNDGILPIGGLAMDSNGALYGTTWLGGGLGSLGVGTVYKLSPTGSGYTEQVIHGFRAGNDGSTPWAPVIVESNGDVIGTTVYGGNASGGAGTVFRLTPEGSSYKETILYRFQGGKDGSQPQAPVLDVSGTLYGTTTDGASNFPCRGDCGTVFALTPGAHGYKHAVIARFNDRTGYYARAGLIVYNGLLAGTAYWQGGRHSYAGGSVFTLTP